MANNKVNFQVGFSIDKTGLNTLQSELQRISNQAKELGPETSRGFQQAANTATQLDKILSKTFNTDLGTLNVTKFNQELTKSGMTLKSVKTDLVNAGNLGSAAYNRLAQAILGTNVQLKQSNKLLDSMATTMMNTVKWGITSSIFNNITNSITKAYGYVKQLDTSLNDIRIVTEKSTEDMNIFAENANKAAKALGASTLDYTKASLIYYQQGLSDQEVQARAETTVKVANVTGQTGDAVSEQLTAVWNGYKVSAQETEVYVDKLAAVAATTAADLEELSVGMSKVASAANAMGVDFDDLNAQIATIVSVTRQAPESVGTALKTIYARLGDLKVDGVDEFGVKLGEVSGQLKTMGIEILDQNGNMRDMTSVMTEVAEKWNTWTRAQQQAAAVAMAGKRQYNNLVALFENWDMYSEALETSQESLGTLQKQQDIYMESTTAKLKTLKATWQGLYQDLIKTDDINKGIDILTSITEKVDYFIKSFGGGSKAILSFGAILANVFNKQISNAVIQGINNLKVYQNNLEILEAKMEIIKNGAASNFGKQATPEQLGGAANTRAQIEVSAQINKVKGGLAEGQEQELIQYQQEIGKLQGQITEIEARANNIFRDSSKHITEAFSNAGIHSGMDLLQTDFLKIDEIVSDLQAKNEEVTQQLEEDKNALADIQSLIASRKNTEEDLVKIISKKTSYEIEDVEAVAESLKINLKETLTREDQLKIIKRLSFENKQQLNDIKKESQELLKISDYKTQHLNLDEQRNNKQQELNILLEQANANLDISNIIQASTTLASSAASIYSAMNMLKDAFSEESVGEPFTEKIPKLAMGIAMLGMPTIQLISNFEKLSSIGNTVGSVFQNLTAITNAAQEAKEADNLVTMRQNTLAKAEADLSTKKIAARGAETAAKRAHTEAKKAETRAIENSLVIEKSELDTESKDILITNEMAIADSKHTAAETADTAASSANQGITAAKMAVEEAETGVKEAQTKQEVAHAAAVNASKLAMLGYVAVAAAAVAVVAGSIYLFTKMRENEIEEINAKREEIRAIQDTVNEKNKEIDSNKELINSYLEVYNQYQNGTASKDDLSKATENLIGYISEEQIAIANLTGDYEKLAEAAKQARLEQENQQLINQQQGIQEQIDAFLKRDFKVSGIGSDFDFSDSQIREDFQKQYKYFNVDEFGNIIFNEEAIRSIQNKDEAFDFQKEAQKLSKESEAVSSALGDLQFNSFFSNFASGLANSDELTLKSQIDKEINLEDNKNYQDFEKDFYEVKKLVEEGGYSGDVFEKTLELMKNISSSNNEYIDQIRGVNSLIEQYKEDYGEQNLEDFEEQLKGLTKEDLVYLLDLGVSLDENSLDDVLNRIKAKTAVERNELSIDLAEGFRENFVKDQSKMSKKEKEQLEEERRAFSEQYNLDDSWWEKFDASKPIDQMTILNELIEQQNIELIKNAENAEKINREDPIEAFEERKNELLEDQIDLKNKLNKLPTNTEEYEKTKKDLEEINKELDNIENNIDSLNFDLPIEDQLIELFDNRADQIISVAEQAKNAVELIGEGFLVAADDAQELIEKYPEILEKSEVLANGDIQLNQEVVKTILGGNAEVIQSNAEVTKKKLEQEIAVIQAQIKFNYTRMEILDKYLKGEIAQADKEKLLNQAVSDYKIELSNIVGDAQVNAAYQAEEANVKMTESALNDFDVMIQAASQLGTAIQQALRGEAVTASVKGLVAVGGNVGAYSNYSSTATSEAYNRTDRNINDLKAAEEEMKNLKEETVGLEKAEAELKGILSKINSGTSSSVNAITNVMNGKAGKKDKSKSSSKKEKEKTIDEEFDRYWEYKKAIDMLDKSMARLEKTQSKLHGKELIDSLEKENKLLEKQKANYDALLHAQEREAGELQGKLEYYGAIFADNGELANYADLTSNMLSQLTSGLVSEKAYEDFKKALERYDTLYYSEMQDTMDKLDDARRKQLENNLKAWETEIQIKLDLTEARRNWNDFVRDIEQDFRKIYSDLTIESLFDTKNFKEYNEDLNTTLQAIHDVENEINKLSATGKSDMFQSMSEAQEKLKDLGDELIENGKNLYELYENIWDNYIDKLDQAADNLNDINDEFDHITTELEYEKKLIELIYGDKAYAKMDKFYTTQQKNINAQLNSLKTQRDFWEQQFNATYEMNKVNHNVILNDMSTWTEDMRKAYNEMIDSQEKLNDMIVDGINNLTDKYLNKLAETFDKLEKATWGMNLDDLKDDWDRITGLADEYLDDAEGIPQIQMLINKVNQGIDDTKDLKLQQKLAEFRDNEVQALMDKKDLTEDDLKLMEARYNIMLKEAALEDAQNAKNSMKLTRNTSGNWTYQYVADDTDVAEKQNDLLQSYQDLYKMADDAYQHAMELAMNTYETMQEKMREIAEDTTITEEEKMMKIQEIQDTYLPMIQAAAENSELYRQEAIAATGMIFTEVCEQNEDAYEHLTDEQKILVDATKENHLNDYEAIREAVVDNTYPEIQEAATTAFKQTNLNSSTVAADVIGQWAGDDGESVKNKLNEAIDDIEKNTQDFEDELDNMRDIADIDFSDVDTMIDTTTDKIEDIGNKTEDMVNRSTSQLELMRQYVNDIEVAFGNVIERVFEAISAMAEYTEATAAAVEEMNNLIITSKQYGGVSVNVGGGGGPSGGTTEIPYAGNLKIITDDPNGVRGTKLYENLDTGEQFIGAGGIESATQLYEMVDDPNGAANTKALRNKLTGAYYKIIGMATGGYTGEWDTSGKLAILHQKELVLNQDDTLNFLKATNLLRDISKINGNIEDSIMTSILNMMCILAPKVSGFNMDNKSSEVGGNVFNITAEFPNANDVSSIKEAILSLPNIASQYVHQRS